jgi:mono/diheme cytochrome c family protein
MPDQDLFTRAISFARSGGDRGAEAIMRRRFVWAAGFIVLPLTAGGCAGREPTSPDSVINLSHSPQQTSGVVSGRQIFRHDDFGSWRFWTDTLRLNEVAATLTPNEALALGLKVDADAIPAAVLQAVLDDPTLLDDPATTRALLGLNAVLGIAATVDGDQVTRLGITCALCHSTVNNSVAAGIGSRLDGWPNSDLEVGTIISVAPGLPAALKPIYASWPAGFYDPRFNFDGINAPVVIPPAYGLRSVGLETYTGEGPISYWNAYVAVTQMHGHGSFSEPKLGISIVVPPREDEVRSKLAALRQYQFSLQAPPPPAGSFDAAAAQRGQVLFKTTASCSACHTGPTLTDHGNLHAPDETGMDPLHAQRSTTKLYRTTPLRGLWQHAPYFHDGSAASLVDVVERYNTVLSLRLTEAQRADLVEYLKSL